MYILLKSGVHAWTQVAGVAISMISLAKVGSFHVGGGGFTLPRPAQLAELPHTEVDPKLFPHSTCVKFLGNSQQKCYI